MARVTCPHCYSAFRDRDMWFRCAGLPQPTHLACFPVHDPAQQWALGNSAPSLTAFPPPRRLFDTARRADCPICGGPTGIRVCPVCHSRLSSPVGLVATPLIGIAGAKGVGKTVYLVVLLNALTRTLGARFGADINSASWLNSTVEPMHHLLSRGKLAPITRSAGISGRQPEVIEWRTSARRPRTAVLSLYDTAGEDLGTYSGVEQLRYLGAASAMMVLIDPLSLPSLRDVLTSSNDGFYGPSSEAVDILNRLTEFFRLSHEVPAKAKIDIPVCVVLTKVDLLFDLLGPDHPLLRQPEPEPFYDEKVGAETHEYVRSFLHEYGSDYLDAHLQFNYANFRYFVVSSLGAPPTDGMVDPRGLRPFRIDEPFIWLLNRLGLVEGKR
jgi:hypothetical protein